ncbi:MAG: EamA family transporter [Kiloniellaceae bacterium]|nr:EamA family transporter [Kiloniellaceae bacterium]
MSHSIDQPILPAQNESPHPESQLLGAWLVFGSALVWSLGGIIARLAEIENPWTAVFWRSGTAALFLIAFMLVRDGRAGTVALFARMGFAGLAVAACFAIASTSFVLALQFTTVANVLLMQAGVPLLAALMSRILFGEQLRFMTWLAVAAVISGVAVMVSDSLTGKVSPIGDGLALLIAAAFATATVITRRYSSIRMTPAVCTGSAIGCAVALVVSLVTAGSVAVETWQLPVLGVFGVSLGLGMALFTQGARLIPSAFAALLGTGETILGPFWVWLFLGETPTPRTVIGGAIVLAAILAYLVWQIADNRKFRRLAPPIH